VAHDPERGGHIVELFRNVLAHAPHGTTAVGADAQCLMHDLGAGQMVGQRLSIRPGGLPCPGDHRHRRSGGFRLALFQPEFQLVSLVRQLLRRTAEGHAPQPRDLHPQLLQLGAGSNEHGLQKGDIVGQRGGIGRHARLYQNPVPIHAKAAGNRTFTRPRSAARTGSDAASPPFEQHRQLRRGQHRDAVRGRRPGEPARSRRLAWSTRP
jgi:hypothetical protein